MIRPVTSSYRSGVLRAAVGVVACIMLSQAAALAEGELPAIVNPKTYHSSGPYSLFINPGDRYAQGAGSYQLKKNGITQWTKTFPFTLRDAAVTADGTIGGYGYSGGWGGLNSDVPRHGDGQVDIVILDNHGNIRLHQAIPQRYGRVSDGPLYPIVRGLIIDEARDRMIVPIDTLDAPGSELDNVWWLYRLSSGRSMGRFLPSTLLDKFDNSRFVIAAKAVRDTPLILVHYWLTDDHDNDGAQFALIDLEDEVGNPQPHAELVWSLNLPHDYNLPKLGQARDQMQEWLRTNGAILQDNQPGHFGLHLVAAAARANYAVQRDGNGHWIVTEVSRQPYRPDQIASPLSIQQAWARVPVRALRATGHTVLPVASPEESESHVQEFVVAGRNQLAFIRSLPNRPDALVVVDDAGRVRRQMDLSAILHVKDTTWTGLAWLGGAHYVVGRGVWNGKAAAWIVDIGKHKITPVPGVACSQIKRLAAFSDGGFVLLGESYSMSEVVEAFNPMAQRLWTLKSDDGDKPQSLAVAGAQDVAVTTDNRVVVVNSGPNTIQVFDRHGRYQKTIQLERAWHRKPNYLSGITADLWGGVVVNDFEGRPPIVRMTAAGVVRSQFQPRYRDGRTFFIRGGVQVTPNGNLWTSDGYALLRLKANGVVDRVLGPAPNAARLGAIANLFIDPEGRIYALDDRTSAVHKFNPKSRHLVSFKSLPTDFDEFGFGPRFSVSGSGEVFVEGAVHGGTVHFSRQGQRLGMQRTTKPRGKRATHGSLLLASSHTGIMPHGEDLHWSSNTLLDSTGMVVRTIDRRADGTWMESIQCISAASDGAVAILDQVSPILEQDLWQYHPQFISLYTSTGAPLRTIPVPRWIGGAYHLAYDGQRLILVNDKRVIAMNSVGKVLWQFVPHSMGIRSAFILNRGRTLALFDGHRTVTYYGL